MSGANGQAAQALDALEQANAVRSLRAVWKRKLDSGEATISDVIERGGAEVRSWAVIELLRALPGVGMKRANQIMREAFVAEATTVGGLTARQSEALIERIEARDYTRKTKDTEAR